MRSVQGGRHERSKTVLRGDKETKPLSFVSLSTHIVGQGGAKNHTCCIRNVGGETMPVLVKCHSSLMKIWYVAGEVHLDTRKYLHFKAELRTVKNHAAE